ncbi:NUP159 [Candida metapsilosis]|uniref:NUP159 n=1 Tax=Candida metapsilosis TaxID=273372 RepID=A0A8H7ZIC4_9ASCO|nr:NUP159 [Candida metapsilosis]
MVDIETVISDDYGFKLIDDVPLTEPIDLKQFNDGQELRLLAIHDKHRIIAVSNSTTLKFISADKLDDVDTVGGEFAITQLYFTDSKFYMLNNNSIQMLTIDQIKRKEYQFSSLEGQFTNLELLDDDNYLGLSNGDLYHNSTKIASNVAKFTWHESSPIYTTKSNKFQLMGKPIDFDDETKDKLSDYHLVELVSIKSYLFLIYDISEEQPSDDHHIEAYLISHEGDKYTPTAIDIASPFGTANRTTTYYTASINNWLQSTQLHFITSSLSSDIGIVDVSSSPLQSIEPAEDSNKANYPMDEETSEDVSPVGFAISINELNTKVDAPCVGVEGEVVGKLPKLMRYRWRELLQSNASIWKTPKLRKLDDTPKETLKDDFNSSKDVPPENPFQTTSNPFGSSTAGAFKSPTATNTASDTKKSAFGSTGFGQSTSSAFGSTAGQSTKSAFGSTGFGSGQSAGSAFGASGSAFGATSFGGSQATKSGFGATGFGSSTSASTGFGASGFGSSGFGAPSSNTATKSTLSSGFGKFSNHQPAAFSNTTANGNNIFENSAKPASPFGQSSSTSSPFGKVENKSDSPFDSNQKAPTQAKPMFPQQANTSSPFASLGKDSKAGGIDNTRPTPFADLINSSKESTPGFTPEGASKVNAESGTTQTPQMNQSQSGKEDDLLSAFGGLNTTEKPSSPSSFPSLKKPDGPSPFASLQKANTPSPFAGIGATRAPSDKDQFKNDFDDESESESETNITSDKNTPDEDGSEAHTPEKAPEHHAEEDSLPDIDASGNYDLSQDDEEDEADDQQFVDESERNDSSWVNISKKEENGRILAQELVSLEHEGSPKEEKETEIVVEDTPQESIDEPIQPAEFLVFDGFSGSLETTDDPIANKIRTVIANTEGNLQFLAKNVAAVTGYIDAHSTPGKHWHEITEVGNLQYDKDMYRGKLHYLHEKEAEVDRLNLVLQKSQHEFRALDKSFSQLALLEKGTRKNLKFLKNRPLEPSKQEMREKLRLKLANVESLESKLRALLMPIKAKNSLNSSTVNKIEEILSQLNDQILDHKLALTELEEQMKKMNLEGGPKSLIVKPRAAKLDLRKKLREMNAKQITQ